MQSSSPVVSVAPTELTLEAPGPVRAGAHQHNWDRLRVFASLDIVGSHLGGEHLFGGVGTPLFMILAIAFGVQRPQPVAMRDFARKRLRRVLIPWLAWSCAIAACLGLIDVARGARLFAWWKPEMLLYGPQIHLWFLPVAAAFGLCAHALHRASAGLAPVPVGCCALALGVGSLALCPRLGRGWPFEQWSFSAPALWFGFGLGRLLSSVAGAARMPPRIVTALGVGVAASALLGVWLPSAAPYAQRYAGALALLALAAALPSAPDRGTPRLAGLMLGSYVLHPIVFQLLVEPLLWKLQLGRLAWVRVSSGYLVTLGLVALFRRTRLRELL